MSEVPETDFQQAGNLAKTFSHDTLSWQGNIARAYLAVSSAMVAEHIAGQAIWDYQLALKDGVETFDHERNAFLVEDHAAKRKAREELARALAEPGEGVVTLQKGK